MEQGANFFHQVQWFLLDTPGGAIIAAAAVLGLITWKIRRNADAIGKFLQERWDWKYTKSEIEQFHEWSEPVAEVFVALEDGSHTAAVAKKIFAECEKTFLMENTLDRQGLYWVFTMANKVDKELKKDMKTESIVEMLKEVIMGYIPSINEKDKGRNKKQVKEQIKKIVALTEQIDTNYIRLFFIKCIFTCLVNAVTYQSDDLFIYNNEPVIRLTKEKTIIITNKGFMIGRLQADKSYNIFEKSNVFELYYHFHEHYPDHICRAVIFLILRFKYFIEKE